MKTIVRLTFVLLMTISCFAVPGCSDAETPAPSSSTPAESGSGSADSGMESEGSGTK